MPPHDHALVDLGLGLNERLAPLLRVLQTVRHGDAALHGDDRPGARRLHVAVHRFHTGQLRAHLPVAARSPHEEALEADEPARRQPELQAHVA